MGNDTQELAAGYVLRNSTQQSAGQFLLDKLQISAGMRVLDVGCGPGNLTALIAAQVGNTGHVAGIDPSAERIAIAQTSLAASNLSFSVGRAEDLSAFAAASFDVVFVNSTFHWIADQVGAVREFARVLRPGGRLGVSGGSGDFVAVHERIKAEVLARVPYKQYPLVGGPKFVTRREMTEMLDAAGFGQRELVINTIVKHARDGDEMIDWLNTSSSGATYGGVPSELWPGLREAMKVEWEKVTTEDGINMEMELLVTVAYNA